MYAIRRANSSAHLLGVNVSPSSHFLMVYGSWSYRCTAFFRYRDTCIVLGCKSLAVRPRARTHQNRPKQAILLTFKHLSITTNYQHREIHYRITYISRYRSIQQMCRKLCGFEFKSTQIWPSLGAFSKNNQTEFSSGMKFKTAKGFS